MRQRSCFSRHAVRWWSIDTAVAPTQRLLWAIRWYGGSENERKKHSRGLRGKPHCNCRSAGCRSPGQGQAGPICKDLQPVWRGILLHPRHRYVHQGRRLCASQAEWGSSNGIPAGTNSIPLTGPNTIVNGLFDRASNNFNFSGRAMISVDARNQSEYGTIRAYIRLGARLLPQVRRRPSSPIEHLSSLRVLRLAGRCRSSIFLPPPRRSAIPNSRTSGDTYNYGQFLFAYTAEFGNGVSASISAEAPRQVGVIDGAGGGFSVNGVTITDTAGFDMPDIVGNLRIDQNWGYLGVSGAVHKVAGGYYNGTLSPILAHPDDRFGWAAGVGGLINLPWGDTIGASFVGTKGAVGYATKAGNWQMLTAAQSASGWVADGIFDNILNGGPNQLPIQLTNAWSANAGYEHFWNTRWRTSLYGGYTRVWYDQTAKDIATSTCRRRLRLPALRAGSRSKARYGRR